MASILKENYGSFELSNYKYISRVSTKTTVSVHKGLLLVLDVISLHFLKLFCWAAPKKPCLGGRHKVWQKGGEKTLPYPLYNKCYKMSGIFCVITRYSFNILIFAVFTKGANNSDRRRCTRGF